MAARPILNMMLLGEEFICVMHTVPHFRVANSELGMCESIGAREREGQDLSGV